MQRASIDDEMTSLRKRIEVMDGVAAQVGKRREGEGSGEEGGGETSYKSAL